MYFHRATLIQHVIYKHNDQPYTKRCNHLTW